MGIIVVRIIMVFLGVGGALGIAIKYQQPAFPAVLYGLFAGGVIVGIEYTMRKFTIRHFAAAILGLVMGVVMALLIGAIMDVLGEGFFSADPETNEAIMKWILAINIIVFAYLGMVVALRASDQLSFLIPSPKEGKGTKNLRNIIVDTSVIIDGRVADIAETGFLEGQMIIPRFVLRELQSIADSSDPLKRARGRRGLDILNRIQKDPKISVQIQETDFPDIDEVDAKLVQLAKVLSGKVFTNDYNLNKLAEFQQVEVLNINDLSNALKPVILPGETMNIRIVREGKEAGQGVAYLDDGTMVVVNDGRDKLGIKLDVTVTSVLQTSAGRMIFAEMKNGNPR
jgi:uncharacterized protein YacL